jgi:cation:H+ antiporter
MSLEVIIYLVLGLGVLVVGGELMVRGASDLAAALGVPSIVIGLTVVAFGTSTPELAVSLNAAFQGNANISISNVVGSNIFNVLLILGVSGLITPLVIHSQMIKREVPILIGVTLLFYFFSFDQVITRLEGVILFIGIIAYTSWLVYEAQAHRKSNRELERQSEKEFGGAEHTGASIPKSIMITVIGLALIMLGADWLVEGAIGMAKALGVSDTVIGLTIVAAGTSLPEVVASVMAALKGERDIAVGNVVGSNLYNILAIIGISGALVPSGLAVDPTMLSFDYWVMIGAVVLCWPFFKTGNQLSRFEGAIFLGGYIAYTAYLISRAAG